MSGVPPTDFDFGEPCLACSTDPKGTPARYKLEFTGLLLGIPGNPIPDRSAIVIQIEDFPCFYVGPTTQFNNTVFFNRQPGGFFINDPHILLIGGSFSIRFFKAEGIAECLFNGVFENDYTLANPSPQNAHGGICTLSIN